MTAVERKIVHVALQDYDGVETSSEGTEPNRFVVVAPAGAGSRGNLPVSPDPFHLSADADELLQSWIRAVVATPGLTALKDVNTARRVLLDDSLRGVEIVRTLEGPIVDVGSGGGAPGIPLAAALPDREVTLLEAEERKADFLRGWEAELSERARRVGPCRGAGDGCTSASPSPKHSRLHRSRPSGACRSFGRAARSCSGSSPTCRARSGRPSCRAARGRCSPRTRRAARDPEAGTDAGGLSAPARNGQETSVGLSSLGRAGWPSTRSQTRRAGSERRRLPSTSPPALPRPASPPCSIDLDPQANATSGLG